MAKKRTYKKRKQKASKIDVAIVVLIILSILLAVLIYTKSGVIGSKLNEIFRWNDGDDTIYSTYWYFRNSNKTCK